MFFQFTGCGTNNTFISLTLIFCILLPIAQLTGGEGNLLSVACISAWATFLCYTAIIKNPNAMCNTKIGESSPVSITYGLLLSLISLGWAGWSYTANDKLTDVKIAANTDDIVADTHVTDGDIRGKRDITGVVVVTQTKTDVTSDENYMPVDEQKRTPNDKVSETNQTSKSSNAWRLNVALAVVSCWCAVTLTQWGVIQSNDGTIANRNVGHISMWVIIGSQWLVMTLYLWTLIAPRLFPDRDFS
jgi:serine incorporator 1/3